MLMRKQAAIDWTVSEMKSKKVYYGPHPFAIAHDPNSRCDIHEEGEEYNVVPLHEWETFCSDGATLVAIVDKDGNLFKFTGDTEKKINLS